MNNVTWGVIGTGGQSAQFAQSFDTHSSIIVAVASKTLQHAYEFSKTYSISKAYGSFEELVYDPEIDIVYIAVSEYLLKDTVLMALHAHKHVFCESLTTFNQPLLKELKDIAREKKRLMLDTHDNVSSLIAHKRL